MVMKTLLLVDNQDITREGMKAVAGRVGGFTVIKEAGSQKELTRLLIDHPNAVVVLDYTLFDTSAEYLLILQERFKEAHFILFSDNLSEDFIRRMVFGGTSFSVVMKDCGRRSNVCNTFVHALPGNCSIKKKRKKNGAHRLRLLSVKY